MATTDMPPPAPPAASAPHGPGHASGLGVLMLTSLGVVYGDIGTSPLYALRECFSGPHGIAPTPANILGVLSLIWWSLVLVITIKYVAFILRADNRGEGGILALLALATPIRRFGRSPQIWLTVLGVIGAALLYGDGIITPAISVLSAVEGLKIAAPVLGDYVVPLALAIIIGLFLIQRSGTQRIGRLFGPIMLVWFTVLAALGLANLVHAPEVLAAVNPLHGVRFFGQNGLTGFLVLGTVFLVVTGGEALYADMGHFGARPIRLAWLSLVLPALLLNYFGQGALLLREPEAAENAFYLLAPSWALYPLVGLATLATIIASQALISGAFSITMQAEHLGFLPRMRIIHTSASAHGQIYIPVVNWLLLVACLLVVLGFGSSSRLAAAYGIAVTSTMVITTIIFCVVASKKWGWSPLRVALIGGLFLVVDAAFFGANLLKIPQGGWFPLAVALGLFILMVTWKRGGELVFNREQSWDDSIARLVAGIRSQPPTRTPGPAIFLSARPSGAPAALLANMRYNGVIHEHVLLTTVHTAAVPHVPPAERLEVRDYGEGIYLVTLHFGFMQETDVPQALRLLSIPGVTIDPINTPYFVNRTNVIPSALPGMWRWREHLYRLMRQNSASAVDFFELPPTCVFEIGTSIEL